MAHEAAGVMAERLGRKEFPREGVFGFVQIVDNAFVVLRFPTSGQWVVQFIVLSVSHISKYIIDLFMIIFDSVASAQVVIMQ